MLYVFIEDAIYQQLNPGIYAITLNADEHIHCQMTLTPQEVNKDGKKMKKFEKFEKNRKTQMKILVHVFSLTSFRILIKFKFI